MECHRKCLLKCLPCILPIRSRIFWGFPKSEDNYKLKKDVLRFQIPVKNSFAMHTLSSLEDLFYYYFCLLFDKSLFLFKNSQKMTIRSIFKEHVKAGLIVKETIEIDDVWMIQIELDFKLSCKLMVNFFFHDSLLFDNFHCTNKPSLDILS